MSERKKRKRGNERRRNLSQGSNAGRQDNNPHAFDPDAAYGAGRPYLPSGHTPAELLPRFAARVIDGLIVGIPALFIYRVLSEGMGGPGAILSAFIYGATLVAYATFMEAGSGQTFGKRLLGLQVLGPQGGPPTLGQAFRRNYFYVVSGFVMMPFWLLQYLALAVLFAAFVSVVMSIQRSPHHQGNHDAIADGTQVVRV